MNYVIIQSRTFMRKSLRLGLSHDDIRAIENQILRGPTDWPVVSGTQGMRKMRFAPPKSNAGKSGGMRVCYFVLDASNKIHLLTLFAKNEQADLDSTDRKDIAKIILAIKTTYQQESSHAKETSK